MLVIGADIAEREHCSCDVMFVGGVSWREVGVTKTWILNNTPDVNCLFRGVNTVSGEAAWGFRYGRRPLGVVMGFINNLYFKYQ